MGTQFWWFYDVLLISISCGILYSAVTKGFNKIVFRLIGAVLAMAVSIPVSAPLSQWVYSTLYQEEVLDTVQGCYEEWDPYIAALSFLEQDSVQDSESLTEMARTVCDGDEVDEWFSECMGESAQYLLNENLSPKIQTSLSEMFATDTAFFQGYLTTLLETDTAETADVLETQYIRPVYTEMVRMAVFLILSAVVLIVVGILSRMTGNLEEQMHIRKYNRVLAAPVGLIEVICMALVIAVSVKLLVLASNGEMLLFNEETISETKLFRYIYQML